MLAAVRSATLLGVEGQSVTVEVHVSDRRSVRSSGPDEARRESRSRVAVMSSGLSWPSSRATVNRRPATNAMRNRADWPSRRAVVANGDIPGEAVERLGLLGRLGLDGRCAVWRAPMVGVTEQRPGGARRRFGKHGRSRQDPSGSPRTSARSSTRSMALRRGPTSPTTTSSTTSRRSRISPMCAARRLPDWRSKLLRRAVTIFCLSAHPERERRCWPRG
jgi:hypothetical protein